MCHRVVLELTGIHMSVYRAPGESRYPDGRPFNWETIDQAAKWVSPFYSALMDPAQLPRNRRIFTLNDVGINADRVLRQLERWATDPRTPSDVVICYHDPQASQDFTTRLIRKLLGLSIMIQDA